MIDLSFLSGMTLFNKEGYKFKIEKPRMNGWSTLTLTGVLIFPDGSGYEKEVTVSLDKYKLWIATLRQSNHLNPKEPLDALWHMAKGVFAVALADRHPARKTS